MKQVYSHVGKLQAQTDLCPASVFFMFSFCDFSVRMQVRRNFIVSHENHNNIQCLVGPQLILKLAKTFDGIFQRPHQKYDHLSQL